MAQRTDITPELLRIILSYDPDTGILTWLPRSGSDLLNEGRCKAWNKNWAGKEAFTSLTCGYRLGTVFSVPVTAHRIAWAIYYGEFPKNHIDHINGVRNDNRICNLRDVDTATNGKNRRTSCNNTSGCTGVYWRKREKRWRATIKAGGKDVYIGTFHNKHDAVRARKAAERKIGFHENHGRKEVGA